MVTGRLAGRIKEDDELVFFYYLFFNVNALRVGK